MGAPLRPKGHHSELSTRAPAPLGNPLRCLAAALIAWAIYLTTLVVIDARDTPASTESLTTMIEGALVVAATICDARIADASDRNSVRRDTRLHNRCTVSGDHLWCSDRTRCGT